MTENHLGRNIYEAPVTYHIPDDEDQVGSLPKKTLLNPVPMTASEHV
jgi:hypothetical protein